MLVRMLISMQGPGGTHQRGAVIDLEDHRARALIEEGKAEPVPMRLSLRPVATAKRPAPGAQDAK